MFIYFAILYLITIIVEQVSANVILLDSVSGTVYRGNFTHWSLGFTGHIILSLQSLNGDADLYITENNKKASYEPTEYDLHAASCGLDVVEIPRNFIRPIGIGIYGHPSHENSTYILDVLYDVEKSHIKSDEIIEDNGNYYEDDPGTNKPAFTGVKKFKIKAKLLAGIWSLLEIFDILFTF